MLRAADLAGQNIASLAGKLGMTVPDNLASRKGWIGELIEKILGANASTLPEPDFMHLGIELKTIPIRIDGSAQESTFVCTASLINQPGLCWENSLVRKKLDRVLWIPVEADHQLLLSERRIGSAFLWRPSEQQRHMLKQDWNEIMEFILTGQLDRISAATGQYLQLRPKAANAKSLCNALDADGNIIQTLPRGFYLRTCFTNEILKQACL